MAAAMMPTTARAGSGRPARPKAPRVLSFAALVDAVRRIHEHSASAASRAVNVSLTLRNWVIGCYIVRYERNGADRAQYSQRLMDRLAEELRRHGIPSSDRQRLYAYVGFYRAYPQVGELVPLEWPTHRSSSQEFAGQPLKAVGKSGRCEWLSTSFPAPFEPAIGPDPPASRRPPRLSRPGTVPLPRRRPQHQSSRLRSWRGATCYPRRGPGGLDAFLPGTLNYSLVGLRVSGKTWINTPMSFGSNWRL